MERWNGTTARGLDRDIIRMLDIASIVKDADGPVTTIYAALGS